jgi:Fur family ferric uptake transcriptional regulator
MRDHAHFHCDGCSRVFDIDLSPTPALALPRGFVAERYDIVMHGRCAECSGSQLGRG